MCVCQDKMHQLRGGMTGHVPIGYLGEYLGYSQWEILVDMQPLYSFVAKIDRTIELCYTVGKRKRVWLWHVLRHESIPRVI